MLKSNIKCERRKYILGNIGTLTLTKCVNKSQEIEEERKIVNKKMKELKEEIEKYRQLKFSFEKESKRLKDIEFDYFDKDKLLQQKLIDFNKKEEVFKRNLIILQHDKEKFEKEEKAYNEEIKKNKMDYSEYQKNIKEYNEFKKEYMKKTEEYDRLTGELEKNVREYNKKKEEYKILKEEIEEYEKQIKILNKKENESKEETTKLNEKIKDLNDEIITLKELKNPKKNYILDWKDKNEWMNNNYYNNFTVEEISSMSLFNENNDKFIDISIKDIPSLLLLFIKRNGSLYYEKDSEVFEKEILSQNDEKVIYLCESYFLWKGDEKLQTNGDLKYRNLYNRCFDKNFSYFEVLIEIFKHRETSLEKLEKYKLVLRTYILEFLKDLLLIYLPGLSKFYKYFQSLNFKDTFESLTTLPFIKDVKGWYDNKYYIEKFFMVQLQLELEDKFESRFYHTHLIKKDIFEQKTTIKEFINNYEAYKIFKHIGHKIFNGFGLKNALIYVHFFNIHMHDDENINDVIFIEELKELKEKGKEGNEELLIQETNKEESEKKNIVEEKIGKYPRKYNTIGIEHIDCKACQKNYYNKGGNHKFINYK